MYTKYTGKLAYSDPLNNKQIISNQLYQHIKEGSFQLFFFSLINVTNLTKKAKQKLYFLNKSFEVNKMLQGSW